MRYTEYNVAVDAAARQEMVDKSGRMAVPQIHIDGDIILGFNPAALREKLGLKK